MENTGDVTRFTSVDPQTDQSSFVNFLDAGNALDDIKKSVKLVMPARNPDPKSREKEAS